MTDLEGGGKDSHPAAKLHQREGLLCVFQQLHDDGEGVVVKAPKCLAQGERARERGERGEGEPQRSSRNPSTFRTQK